jgi:diguanylate cyclase (GGDEF)-like protein
MAQLFDVGTVAVCNAAASYILALTVASARSRLVVTRGIRAFAWAAGAAGTAFLLVALPGVFLPGSTQTLIGVPMMTLSVGLIYVGACLFSGRPSRTRWVVASVAFMFLLTAGSLHYDFLLKPRLLVFSVLGATWTALSGVHLLRYVDRSLGFGRTMSAVALIAIACTFLLRAIALFVFEIEPDPLANNITNRISFFIGTVLSMLALAGASAMVNTKIGLEIARIAERDVLTGTLSRFGLKHTSARWIAQHPGGHLLLVDLDHFKQINDVLGHERGDDVLRAFSDVASKAMPAGALIARYGGDEFVILLPRDIESENFGLRLIEQFDARMKVLFGTDRRLEKLPTLSIGVATVRESLGDAVRRADRALYRAKSEGRARIATSFDAGLSRETSELPYDPQ